MTVAGSLVVALLLGSARAVEPETTDISAELADAPAVERSTDDGLWGWIEQVDAPGEAGEAIDERSEAELSEMALIDELGAVDVPLDFYVDPLEALRVDPLRIDEVDPSEFDIPVTVNPAVEKWMRYFTGPGRKYYAKWLNRASRYRPLMYAELEERGMPADLVYLSMIESGYNAHAYSHAHAAGLWQFIPSTGRLYGLRVDWWIDERRDPEKATKAAAEYLTDLHEMFDGDWYLAFAAYNGGPGRVRRAIRQSGSRDFWTLAEGPYLHSETDNYVPKILAAAIIGKHPERYGFTDIQPQPELVYDTAEVEGMIELEVLAKTAGMPLDDFRHLNPALRRWATPAEKIEVRLPKGTGEAFAAALAEVPASERLTFARHTVARGETLSAIASRYGVSVSDVTRANRLRDADRIYVGMSLVIPIPGAPAAKVAQADKAPAERSRPESHTVRSGDTLSGIAARYGLTVQQLSGFNGLRGSTIYVGQTLRLSGASQTVATVKHTVARGETLSGIAGHYGVKLADLQTWNGIRNASHIQVGQTLTVHLSEQAWTTYTVRSGDSLGRIATRHRCSVDELRQWNELSSTVIHPGQELRIRR